MIHMVDIYCQTCYEKLVLEPKELNGIIVGMKYSCGCGREGEINGPSA